MLLDIKASLKIMKGLAFIRNISSRPILTCSIVKAAFQRFPIKKIKN